MQRDRYSQEGTQISDWTIEFIKINVERLAFGTTGLFVKADALNIQSFEDRLVEQLPGGLHVFRPDAKLNASNEVGDEPVETHHVVVAQKTWDACRLEAAFREQRLRQVAKLADRYQRSHVQNLGRIGGVGRLFQPVAVHFAFDSLPSS